MNLSSKIRKHIFRQKDPCHVIVVPIGDKNRSEINLRQLNSNKAFIIFNDVICLSEKISTILACHSF